MKNIKQHPKPVVKSATRTLDILEFVAETHSATSFQSISNSLGIPTSSLFYLLATLTERGYLKYLDYREGYVLGPALENLLDDIQRTRSLKERIVVLLLRLKNRLNETTCYFERRGDEVECILVRLPSQTLLPLLKEGQYVPMYASSAGKAFLASMSDNEVESYLSHVKLTKLTSHTNNSRKKLLQELKEIRTTGFSYSREELTLGVIGISTLLRNSSGEIVGVLGVAVAAVRFNKQVDKEIQKELLASVNQFAQKV